MTEADIWYDFPEKGLRSLGNRLIGWIEKEGLKEYVAYLDEPASSILRKRFLQTFTNDETLICFYWDHLKTQTKAAYITDGPEWCQYLIDSVHELTPRIQGELFWMANETEDKRIIKLPPGNFEKLIKESYGEEFYLFDDTFSWALMASHEDNIIFCEAGSD